MPEQTKEPTDPAPTKELPPPSSDINTEFMQTEQCAKTFKWIAIGYINTIISLFTYPVIKIQAHLIIQLLWCCFALLSWCFIAKGMTDLKSLSPSMSKIRSLSYFILLLAIGVVVSKLLIHQKVLGDIEELSKLRRWLGLLELYALFILPLALLGMSLSTITKISIITENKIVHKDTKIIKGLFYIYFPALVCTTLMLFPTGQVDGRQLKGHANPVDGIIMVVCFIAMLVITTALIAGASQLLFKTAKMCRTFGKTKNKATQPETQNV